MTVAKKCVSFEENLFKRLENSRADMDMSRSGYIDSVLRVHFGLDPEETPEQTQPAL
jgi:hypothetical protein